MQRARGDIYPCRHLDEAWKSADAVETCRADGPDQFRLVIERLQHAMAEICAHSRGYRIRVWALLLEQGRIKMPLHGPGIKLDPALEGFGIKRSMLWRWIRQQQSS